MGWFVLCGVVIVLGALIGNLAFLYWFRLLALPARPAVRLATVTGALIGYLVAAYLVPVGGALVSFMGGSPTPGLYWLGGMIVILALITIPGWK